jgi:hypothetical protein
VKYSGETREIPSQARGDTHVAASRAAFWDTAKSEFCALHENVSQTSLTEER